MSYFEPRICTLKRKRAQVNYFEEAGSFEQDGEDSSSEEEEHEEGEKFSAKVGFDTALSLSLPFQKVATWCPTHTY